MSKGERVIIKDDKGKQYELIRVLDLDTEKIIKDLSALVVKKDKIIDLMAEEFINKTLMYNNWQKNDLIEYFEERCK